MKQDGISFLEAARMLAGKYGIHLPEKDMTPSSRRIESEREELYAINKMAMGYFKQTLFESERGEVARNYLKDRGIHGKFADEFNLGYVPDGWDNLSRFLLSRKISRDMAEKSGLIVSKNKERYYDRFRNRIIFPIIDLSQRIIGFGGRVLDQSLPKYLNSPETLVYNKSKSLYGFNRTKQSCRETDTVHIVEGYFDLLSLFLHGVENVVATLGTAITRDHVRMLSRSGVKKFVLVFDSDEAGIKAAERSIPIFQKEFISANILVLPKPHDPDSYIREFGPDMFRKASEKAMGIIPFLSESSVKKHGLSIEGRVNVISDMKDALALVDDPIARSLYIRELAHRIGVDEKAVLEKVKEQTASNTGAVLNDGYSDGKQINVMGKTEKSKSEFYEVEKQIVSMMIQFPDIIEECRENHIADYFEDLSLKRICENVLAYEGVMDNMASHFMTQADNDGERQLIASLASGDIPYLYRSCVNLIRQFITRRKKTEDSLSLRIRAAEENNDEELLLKLIHEKNIYSKSLNKKINTRKR
jgi:DNA primase